MCPINAPAGEGERFLHASRMKSVMIFSPKISTIRNIAGRFLFYLDCLLADACGDGPLVAAVLVDKFEVNASSSAPPRSSEVFRWRGLNSLAACIDDVERVDQLAMAAEARRNAARFWETHDSGKVRSSSRGNGFSGLVIPACAFASAAATAPMVSLDRARLPSLSRSKLIAPDSR
jgi:hypothetical protein